MNKHEYLKLPKVDDFIQYLIEKLSERNNFFHTFKVRDNRIPSLHILNKKRELKITSLEDAFDKYWWDRGDFKSNKLILDEIQKVVLNAISKSDDGNSSEEYIKSIHKVLEWGAGGTGQRLYTANIAWAKRHSDDLVKRMTSGIEVMSGENPDTSVFSRGDGPRMNAGFTKYYSLACKNVVIYDGRVGAALGLLVRDFCLKNRISSVPAELAFRWGAQNGKNPLNRNPSINEYVFKSLPATGGAVWAECNIKANWILKAAKDCVSKTAWCGGEDGIRKIESSLFTLGYSIPK